MRPLIKRIALTIAILLLALVGIALTFGWMKRQHILVAAQEWIESRIVQNDIGAKPPMPDAASYEVLCAQLQEWRSELYTRHRKAATAAQKEAIENEARVILEHSLPAMMRCWIGTKWDFNGIASKPGEGKIACGYFVSTVLRDAGLDVNRFRLAQQPSSNIIRTFIDKQDTTLAYNQDYEAFVSGMTDQPAGVYICGLDTHVAFIVNQADSFRFIHSSGSKPWAVVDESPEEAGVLQRSKTRMLGNLTANRDFIRTWLAGERIKVVRD